MPTTPSDKWPLKPGVIGGDTISGPYWIEPHTPAPPVEVGGWIVREAGPEVDSASVLSRWILDPDSAPPDAAVARDDRADEQRSWRVPSPDTKAKLACAFATFDSERDEVRVAHVPGAVWFLWNGEPFVADRDRRGFEGVPVHVRRGKNSVYVACDAGPFEFTLHEPRSTTYVDRFDVVWPSAAYEFGDELGLNVFNASTNTIRGLCTHYGHVSGWGSTCTPVLTDWRDGGYMIPLGMARRGTYFDGFGDECPVSASVDHGCEYVAISVFTGDGSPAERLLLRRGEPWSSRKPNNMTTVARAPRGDTVKLADLFAPKSFHVQATAARADTYLATVRLLQQTTWYDRGTVPWVQCDADVGPDTLPASWSLTWSPNDWPVVLHGNATTNLCWKTRVHSLGPLKVDEGRVSIGDAVYEGDDLAGWYLGEKLGPPGSGVLFDTGAKGARLALLLAATWEGSATPSAVFRVDPSQPCGWRRLDEARVK